MPCPPTKSLPTPARSGFPRYEALSVTAALQAITAEPGPARTLICGSLHLAGVVLADNG